MAKPTRLRYTGKTTRIKDDNGNVIAVTVDRSFPDVPARDLEEADIAELDAATIKNITGGPDPLYVDDSPEPESKPEPKPAEKPAEKAKA